MDASVIAVQEAPAAAAMLNDASRKRIWQAVTAALVFLAFAALPFGVTDVYLLNVLILLLIYAAMSQAWNILGGYCGQISLGNGLYFGVGAYTATILFVNYGITPWAGIVLGGVLSAALALLLGYPCFRLKGHYFSIATIVIAETGLILVHNWDYAGGALGIQWPIGTRSWWTLQFGRDKVPYFYLALVLAISTWLATFIIEDTRAGFWWRAVKDNPLAAESLGVDVFWSKMTAAAISAFFTAAGGGLYAAFVSYIDPENVMSFRFSLLFALPAVLGGIGTLWGPLAGAAILIPLTEFTRSYLGGSGSGADLMIYGALIVVIALLKPEGLLSIFRFRGGMK
jgi:branched-chain amino acid transport system permease protein